MSDAEIHTLKPLLQYLLSTCRNHGIYIESLQIQGTCGFSRNVPLTSCPLVKLPYRPLNTHSSQGPIPGLLVRMLLLLTPQPLLPELSQLPSDLSDSILSLWQVTCPDQAYSANTALSVPTPSILPSQCFHCHTHTHVLHHSSPPSTLFPASFSTEKRCNPQSPGYCLPSKSKSQFLPMLTLTPEVTPDKCFT